eukprot:SAG31_NODE_14723_length_790_cov_1.992764_2_plen_126_part_01
MFGLLMSTIIPTAIALLYRNSVERAQERLAEFAGSFLQDGSKEQQTQRTDSNLKEDTTTNANPLPDSDWIQKFDSSSGHPYYVNTHTGESSWVAPIKSLERTGDEVDPTSLDGWETIIDASSGHAY